MKYIFLFFFIFLGFQMEAQKYSYEVALEPIEIPELGGLQSYSYAQHNGEWLLIGGRLDGLHRRQPFAAFDASGNNVQAIVVNPDTKEIWKASYNNLQPALMEQLSSTNMQFKQEGDHLILTGGYAFSPTADDHVTFPNITVVKVSTLIEQIKNNNITTESFISQMDQIFAVCGGQLEKIEDTFYLVGGHRFDGPYNPMGPNHGPGFMQEYTNEVRPFQLTIADSDISVTHLPAHHDEMHLHRRDYNLVPQIRNGKEELMIFSGVFQNTSDVPWLYPVTVDDQGIQPIEDFLQYYNHYHCASVPIYNESEDEMHNIFFGGIAQFYDDNGILVQDNDVPFVNTIADVSRDDNGLLNEEIISSQMPGLLGAGSEFILMPSSPVFDNGVLKGDDIGFEFVDIGYIYGGIRSSMPNIFFVNNGNESEASNTIFKVSLRKKLNTNSSDLSIKESNLLVYPNPAQNLVRISITLESISDINVEVYDSGGILVGKQTITRSSLKVGQNYLVLDRLKVNYGAYYYKFKFDNKVITRKVIWTE